MAPPTTEPCAQCGKHTTNRCGGCIDGPEYIGNDAVDVFYCSKTCLVQHRPTHQPYCNRITKRKEVTRAGQVLKQAFLTYKEIFYEHDIASVEVKDGVFTIYQPPHDRKKSRIRGTWGPFPDNVTNNTTEREAALSIEQCDTAVALVYPLSQKLLSGTGWGMFRLSGRVGKPVFHPTFNGFDRKNTIGAFDAHTVIAVEHSELDENFIFDPSGSQYGISKACMPIGQYEMEYQSTWNRCVPYIGTGLDDIDNLLNGTDRPDLVMLYHSDPECIADLQLERRTRVHFACFIDKRKGLDRTMLGGSDAVFKQKMDAFIADLKTHLQGFEWKRGEKK